MFWGGLLRAGFVRGRGSLKTFYDGFFALKLSQDACDGNLVRH